MRKILLSSIALACAAGASAQWTTDPTVNTNISDPITQVYEWDFGVNPDNSIFTVFSGPQEGRINMWYNLHDNEGKSIYDNGPQLLASEPTMSWTQVGEIAYHDSKGNMLIAYKSYRSAIEQGLGEAGVNLDLYKVSPSGELLWDTPLDLNRGNYAENIYYGTTMAELEDGSYIVAYAEFFLSNIGKIYLERISADGEFLWEEPLTLSEETVSYTYPYLLSAGDNQVILMYAKGTNQDLMMRKIDFEGNSVWGKDVTVYRGGFPSSVPVWTLLSFIPDGEGGALVGWRDDRYFTNYEKTYVSHVLSDGSFAYASGIEGETVSYTEMRSFEPTMLYDKENKCLYTLHRETSASQSVQRLVIQKMSESGELLWGADGVEMRPDDGSAVAYFDLQFAEDGNVVAFYMAQPNGIDAYGLVHKFNAETGEAMWENDIVFTPQEASRSSLKATPLIDGKYWIVMWEDSRYREGDPEQSAERCHLYMQRINIDGTLGDETSVEIIDADDDIKIVGRTVIAPQGAEIYSLDGVRSDAENLNPGIYVVRSGENVRKIVIR